MAATENLPARSGRSTVDLVRAGARLSPEEWDDARVAAAIKLLPAEFRDPQHAIAYLARCQSSGLSPFLDELWAWKDKRGNLTFMLSRDALIRKAREDGAVQGLDFGLIHEEDDFGVVKEAGRVHIEHSFGFPRGKIVGAYCAVHMEPPEDDHVFTAEVDDYSHLMGKTNWKQNLPTMLETRVISTSVRMKVPAVAGLYTQAEMELEGDYVAQQDRSRVGEQTDAATEALAAQLSEESTVQVEATEEPAEPPSAPVEPEPPAQEAVQYDESEAGQQSELDMETEPEEVPEENLTPCPICTKLIAPRSMGGHMAGHAKRDETLPDDYVIVQDDGGYKYADPDGVVHGWGPKDRPYSGWKQALEGAHTHHEHRQRQAEADAEAEARKASAREAAGKEPVRSTSSSETETPPESPATSSDSTPETEENDGLWEQAYSDLQHTLHEYDRGTDVDLLYSIAEKLWPSKVSSKTGRVKLTELTTDELGDLHLEIEEHLSGNAT